MNAFSRSISRIFEGAAKAFRTFPAAIAAALAFAVVTMIRIELDWPEQEAYHFLFNCLHWALALGAVFSLAAITAAHSRANTPAAFRLANLGGAAAAVIAFFALYTFGGTEAYASGYETISALAGARIAAAVWISLLAFLILAGYPAERSDFARSLFMTQKAFFIALLYGGVIMAGLSGVAGAVQALLYRDMSYKVYEYLGTLAGFLAFTIFVGYFPDFRKGETDEHRETAQRQPRFIEILFGYIMIPIMFALTIVLLIWAATTVVTGTWPAFDRLSAIAASYAAAGIWLHVMVTRYESGLANYYRRLYPITALVILAFEAWALIVQLQKSGLKTAEYFFILVWAVTVASTVLLMLMKSKAHTVIAVLLSAAAVFSVLPAVGYHALPVAAQVSRLTGLLAQNGMLKDGTLTPAAAEPALSDRRAITDAVSFLAYAEDAKLPVWFDRDLGQSSVFKEKLGFEQRWPQDEDNPGGKPGEYLSTYLSLPAGAVEIGGYRWAVYPEGFKTETEASVTVEGERGVYEIYWTQAARDGMPSLRIELAGRVILEQDLRAYADRIMAAYPPSAEGALSAAFEDLSLPLETPEITALLVFTNVSVSLSTGADDASYWFDLNALYLDEKPTAG